MPLAVISPAKTFNEKLSSAPFPFTEPAPALAADHAELLRLAAALTRGQLKGLMGVSDAIAELNVGRFARFAEQPRMNAAVAFDGPAHKALSFATLDADSQAYAQAHVVTLSGLYGVLRPRDAVRPYRLEMGTKLRSERGENLYAFWGERLGAELCRWLGALPAPQRFVVNVASQEYWAAVGKHLGADVTVWHVDFPGASVHAKQARGLFCRFMAEARVLRAEDLSGFAGWSEQAGLGHAYRLASRSDGEGSDGRRLRFERVTATRGAQPAVKPVKAKAAAHAAAAPVEQAASQGAGKRRERSAPDKQGASARGRRKVSSMINN